ncbi:MAG TPA: acyl-CoA thioesterase [bacterium]|nr:acyl-CoA thioesterase [bacterium]HPN45361.1 acyl-CoA thioesterase [bacterium]
MKKSKSPFKSITECSYLVRPGDANSIGTVFGGRILELMDMTASICARRHSQTLVSTIAVEDLHFHRPLVIGMVVKVIAMVNRTFTSSLEINVEVFGEDTYKDEAFLAASGFFILVGMDQDRKPVPVPDLIPLTAEQIQRWEEAGVRREKRLANRKRE